MQGRFTSVDPLVASGKIYNPQTWNRYSYVLNRPTGLIDPTGLEDEEPIRVTPKPKPIALSLTIAKSKVKPPPLPVHNYVFINFNRTDATDVVFGSDHNENSTIAGVGSPPNFKGVKNATVIRNGSSSDFDAANSDPFTGTIIYIGHSWGRGAGIDADPYHGRTLSFSDRGLTWPSQFGISTNAENVFIFACDSQAYAGRIGAINVVAMDSGPNGETSVPVLMRAGHSAAMTLFTNAGTFDAAFNAANARISESQTIQSDYLHSGYTLTEKMNTRDKAVKIVSTR